MPYSRRQLLGGIGGGAVAGILGKEGAEAAWNWATRNPRAPRGNVNLGEIDEDNIDWDAEINAGEESVFYQLSVSGPNTDEDLLDTGMPSGRSNTHSGEFEPSRPGTYRFALDAQTDTYDRTLDQAEMTVFGPLEPDTENAGDSGQDNGSDQDEPHWTENYSGRDFSGDLVAMGQSQANAVADLFETAYSDSRGIFDVDLVDADDADTHNLDQDFSNYNDPFLKVNNLASPVYDGTPNTENVEGLGLEEEFVSETLEALDTKGELKRVGQEYADDVLGL